MGETSHHLGERSRWAHLARALVVEKRPRRQLGDFPKLVPPLQLCESTLTGGIGLDSVNIPKWSPLTSAVSCTREAP